MELKERTSKKLPLSKRMNCDYTAEYIASKILQKEIVMPFECGDNVERDVQTAYMRARRKLCKHDELLENQREDAIQRRADLDKEWEALAEKEKNFRTTFKSFNKFVRENNEKRNRAKQKILDMKHFQVETKHEIDAIKQYTKELIEVKYIMDKNIASHRIYENYLNDVVDEYSQNFTFVGDIIKRYESLVLARNKLQELQQRDMELLEKARTDFDKIIRRYCVTVSGLHNKLADLHERHENAKQIRFRLEDLHQKASLEAMNKLREMVAVKDSCWLIYSDICKRKQIEPTYKDNYAKQLDVIKKNLLLLEHVNKAVRHMEEEKQKLSQIAQVSIDKV